MANSKHLAELNNGVKSWNQWRRENPCIIPNFNGADLSLIDLSFVDLKGANLSGANLSGTRLISANFSKADLRNANLSKANLKFANLSDSNLRKANLSGVDLTEAYLRRTNLSGANLSQAILNAANFGSAELSRANLNEASLRSAILKEANLESADLSVIQGLGTDFTKANLSKACICDWNINSKTNLCDVQCDYVYLDKSSSFEFSNRFPRNGKFQPGEFIKRFQKTSESTEILFTNGMSEFFQSFQELQHLYSDEVLVVQAIEPKSENAFVARLEVIPEASKEASKGFYEEQHHLIEATYRLLQENIQILNSFKQQHSNVMEVMKLLAVRPINISVEANAMSSSEGFTNNLQGANIANFANQVRDNARQQANQHNYGLANKTLADAAREIQTLLNQLSQSYPTDTTPAKYAFANETIRRIDNDPDLTQRILSAFKAGSTSALEQLLNHPAASFVISALEDWYKTRVQ